MDLPLSQHLHGKRCGSNPNEHGFPAARARGGRTSPDGQRSQESCRDSGEVRSHRCHSAAAIRGRRDAGNSELPAPCACACSRCCAAARGIFGGEAQRDGAGARQERGAVGQRQELPCRFPTPSRRGSGGGGGSRGSGSRVPRSWGAGAAARSTLIELLLLQGDCDFIGLFLAVWMG